MAAYPFDSRAGKARGEWNERASSDRHFKRTHPINFKSWYHQGRRLGLQRARLVRRRLPDRDIAGLVGRRLQAEYWLACRRGARPRFLSNNPPTLNGRFLSEGYELKDSANRKAAFGKAYDAALWWRGFPKAPSRH